MTSEAQSLATAEAGAHTNTSPYIHAHVAHANPPKHSNPCVQLTHSACTPCSCVLIHPNPKLSFTRYTQPHPISRSQRHSSVASRTFWPFMATLKNNCSPWNSHPLDSESRTDSSPGLSFIYSTDIWCHSAETNGTHRRAGRDTQNDHRNRLLALRPGKPQGVQGAVRD